ncbi:MAG: LuxR C-terminal-related transcriptional regulator [Treponema sp.]|nr:LuxR C-terminal-related transcriptional regulator [Treponema sp.]
MHEQFFHSNVPIVLGNQQYLERPQIHRLLEKAMQYPIVTVVAGAGYGKTQAVYSFVRKYNVLTTWMQLSERDNLSLRFWENFVKVVTFINKDTAAKLVETSFPETERQFDRYVAIPRTDVNSDWKYIFVYDDFHLLHDAAVLRFMERCITTPFPNITSIIISRSDPPINTRFLRSKGMLATITEDDLRFSQDEMVAYFRMQDIKVSPETAFWTYRSTEGWAFAINLAGLALKNEPPGKGYASSSVKFNVFKLLESEIMSVSSEGLRKYLIKLSLIDHLALELLTELAGNTGLLEEMKQIGSFIRYDSYLNVYHIHNLFLEYLIGKQGELTEEETRNVYLHAARWCGANNFKMDAMSYYEKAGAYHELFEVVYTLPLVIPNAIAQFLLELCVRAPAALYRQNALAWILYTRTLITLELFEKARVVLKDIIAELEAASPSPFQYRTLSGCYNALGFIGLITSMHTQDYTFVPWFERAYHYYRLSGHEIKGPITVGCLCSYACRVSSPEPGAIKRFIEAVSAMVPYVSRSLKGCFYGIDKLAWAELAWFRGEVTAAETLAYEALYKARKQHQYEIENRSIFYLLRISLYQGNRGHIQELFTLLEAQLETQDYVNRYTFHDIVTGWFYVHIGQTARVAAWLRNDFEESDLNSLVYGLEILVRAKYHFIEKQYPAALASLGNQKSRYSFKDFLFGKLEMKVLEALCCHNMKDTDGALRALEAAYALALPNTLDMPFIEAGKDMRALSAAVLKDPACVIPKPWLKRIQREATTYARKLFAVAGAYQKERRLVPVTPLSRREMAVLTGLSQGLTRAEIAEDNDISINTVKSVIKSVYHKLGAINRANAVRLAAAGGILPAGGAPETRKGLDPSV